MADPEAQDLIEIDLPEGVELDTLGIESPAVETPSAPAPPPEPSPVAPPDRANLTVALRKERLKSKGLTKLWKDAEQKLTEVQNRNLAPAAVPFDLEDLTIDAPTFDVEAIKREADANAQATMGDHAELVLKRVQEGFQKLRTSMLDGLKKTVQPRLQERLSQAVFQGRIAAQEEVMRWNYDDFDQMLVDAGIWEMVQAVQDPAGRWVFKNPELAKDIYTDRNPPFRAYELALSKLGKLPAGQADAPGPESPTPAPPAKPVVVAAPAPAPAPAPPPPVKRVGGIRMIPSAGTPRRAQVSREALDQIRDSNPEAYAEMLEKNPRLVEYHLGAIDAL